MRRTARAASVSRQRESPPPPARTVKPERRLHKPLPVIALGTDIFLAETGETGTMADLIDNLPNCPPTLFSAVGAADFVAMLDTVFSERTPESWQHVFDVRTKDTSWWPEDKANIATVKVLPVSYFGWQGKGHRDGLFHKIIDPIIMYERTLAEVWPGDESGIEKLLSWAVALRDFCTENNLRVCPTLGGMASQLLRNRRFYPEPRRKVPAAINQRVREDGLPGNHYFLNVTPDPDNNFTAHYLDQHHAHHYHARNVPLPDSNHCYAYGDFVELKNVAFDTVDQKRFMGLYCLDLLPPRRRPVFDWIGNRLEGAFVYSNELQHLLDFGYKVKGVRAAWGSVVRDKGLPKYAEWAEEQLDEYDNAAWLKPLLIATYGTLATKPMTRQRIYRLAKKGVPVTVRTGRLSVKGLYTESPRKLEPPIAYVMQLGMIQAATRSETIGLAQWLDGQGHAILSIHSDSVHVEDDADRPLPDVLPEPWRSKGTLTFLQYINEQAFLSNQKTCLPAVSGQELRKYRQHSNRAPRYTSRPVGASLG